MKSQLKKQLKAGLLPAVAVVDESFSLDPAFVSDPQFVAVRRQTASGQWQFIALSFSTRDDRFFLEVAFSPNGTFPVHRVPLGPDSPPTDGILRFRAAALWATSNRSGGWLIQKANEQSQASASLPPEGSFDTAEAAMLDVKHRIEKWILPYLNTVARTPRP